MGTKRTAAGLFALGLWLVSGLEPSAGTHGDGTAPTLPEARGTRLRVAVHQGRDGRFRYRYLLENFTIREASCSAPYLPSSDAEILPAQGPPVVSGL